MSSVVRTILLAIAALLCVATSPKPRRYTLVGSTPGAGARDVAPGVAPELQLHLAEDTSYNGPLQPEHFTLVAMPGEAAVPGEVSVVPGEPLRVVFHPAAPLAPGHYVFRHDHQSHVDIEPDLPGRHDVIVEFDVR